jgi:hypothetical protein
LGRDFTSVGTRGLDVGVLSSDLDLLLDTLVNTVNIESRGSNNNI